MGKYLNKKSISIQTKYGSHLCVFEPDEKKGIIVIVPGLPGVITWGRNLIQAEKMAKEAIELCIESLVEKMVFKKERRTVKELALSQK